MKYFTRELYERQQPVAEMAPEKVDKYEEEGELMWDAAVDKYEEHLEIIRETLPSDFNIFFDYDFHDSVILDIEEENGVLTMTIDTTGAPWIDGRGYAIDFFDIIDSNGIDSFQKDTWLYEEVHQPQKGSFEIRILCENSEISIAAKKIEIHRLN